MSKTFVEAADDFKEACSEVLRAMGVYRAADWLLEKAEQYWLQYLIVMWSASMIVLATMIAAMIFE